MGGDIAKPTLNEARIGETHGELGMDFSGIYVSQWRKTLEDHSLLDQIQMGDLLKGKEGLWWEQVSLPPQVAVCLETLWTQEVLHFWESRG